MCCCLTLRQDYHVPSHQHTINKKATEPEVAAVHVCAARPGLRTAVLFIRTLSWASKVSRENMDK